MSVSYKLPSFLNLYLILSFFATKGRANPNQYSYDNNGFSQLQNQVDEVKGVMKNNIENVLKRGENLDDLANKSSHFQGPQQTLSVECGGRTRS